jgi:F0F1-type ATP synthase membrane subunit b/b'
MFDKLSTVDREIEEERRAGQRDSVADRERIRELTKSEVGKIQQAARAEIAAAERAGSQEIRAIAAKLATERAAALIREQMNTAAEAALFGSFVGELERAAS